MTPRTALLVSRLQEAGLRHRRGIVTAGITLMTGFAITAVAVAPLVPDAAQLPQSLVSQAVVPEGVSSQLEALALHDLSLVRNDVTRATDNAQKLLARLGINDAVALAFMRSDASTRLLLSGRAGKMVQAQFGNDGALALLVARFPAASSEQNKTHFSRLTLSKASGQWASSLQTLPLSSQVRLSSGTIRSTLFAATDEARLPESVAAQLAEIFSADVDFHRELRKGDTFSVVYESLTADGEPVTWNEGAGRVLAAEFINGKKAHHAVWFDAADGRGAPGGYFGLDGSSRKRSFLASPVEFSRVTSGFAMRFHPILQSWRQHLGVDYGAPIGTPVRSVGDGVVEFAGRQNGYGNVVQIKHSKERSTLYAHLSSMDVKAGQRIDQGQRLGAVGTTGWSTGPHLHFEFRINGQHQDPLSLAKGVDSVPLDAAARSRFAEVLRGVQNKLDIAQTMASAQRGRVE